MIEIVWAYNLEGKTFRAYMCFAQQSWDLKKLTNRIRWLGIRGLRACRLAAYSLAIPHTTRYETWKHTHPSDSDDMHSDRGGIQREGLESEGVTLSQTTSFKDWNLCHPSDSELTLK